MRIVVVLPAPLVPTKPNICPGATENDSPRNTVLSPKRFASRSSSSTVLLRAAGDWGAADIRGIADIRVAVEARGTRGPGVSRSAAVAV
ncbi:hypothetical protein GCM10023205_23700 [Yinghuangia aomiensis]|uniref:Uncharacterized protein n=1 Tax=Yinghuangia aomiensis TaxID=676205 RepID=A0ABP9H2I4_9ACTN